MSYGYQLDLFSSAALPVDLDEEEPEPKFTKVNKDPKAPAKAKVKKAEATRLAALPLLTDTVPPFAIAAEHFAHAVEAKAGRFAVKTDVAKARQKMMESL